MNKLIKKFQVVPETLEPSLQLAAAVLAQVSRSTIKLSLFHSHFENESNYVGLLFNGMQIVHLVICILLKYFHHHQNTYFSPTSQWNENCTFVICLLSKYFHYHRSTYFSLSKGTNTLKIFICMLWRLVDHT